MCSNQLLLIEFSAFSCINSHLPQFHAIQMFFCFFFGILRAFLGVRFGLKDLICVTNLTFCNSEQNLSKVLHHIKFLSTYFLFLLHRLLKGPYPKIENITRNVLTPPIVRVADVGGTAFPERSKSSPKGRTPKKRHFVAKLNIVAI